MAKPRVFISSTYYDLKSLRGELERFIREKGFEPVLNERGNVAYSKESSPEMSCYREIETCDILVSVIGGRFGSEGADGKSSVSQLELKTALDQYKQVYIFIEKDVLAEYRTYLKNKTSNINWSAVDDPRIYKFIEEVYELPNNNAVMSFDTGHEIISLLREQWAGLFQRLLQVQVTTANLETTQELRQSLDTAMQLVEALKDQTNDINVSKVEAEEISTPNHPAFNKIKKLLKVPYRVYFSNISELSSWLEVRNYKAVPEDALDNKKELEWINTKDRKNYDMLKISSSLFDLTGRFVPNGMEWSENLIRKEIRQREPDDIDDDFTH